VEDAWGNRVGSRVDGLSSRSVRWVLSISVPGSIHSDTKTSSYPSGYHITFQETQFVRDSRRL
jgi:hypothetical protein